VVHGVTSLSVLLEVAHRLMIIEAQQKGLRRPLLAGRAPSRWFVTYERGGRGHHLVLAVFDMAAQPPRPVLLAGGYAGSHDDVRGWRVHLSELRAALKDGRLSVEYPNDSYS